jgi:hypothetical protein
MTCERSDLEEEAISIEEHLDPPTRQKAAALKMPAHVLFASTGVGLGERLIDRLESREITLTIGPVSLGLRIGLRTQDWIGLFFGHALES